MALTKMIITNGCKQEARAQIFIYHQIYFSNYFGYLCIEYRLDYINIESLLQRK